MQHGILGAGGVGGLIGAVLARAGESVTLIVRPEAADRHPRELSLESGFGKFSVPVSVRSTAAGPLDVLWITVKAPQLQAALDGIPESARIGTVVPLLNGIDHVQVLRARFGHDRVVPATISVESERTAPGKIVHRSPFVRLNLAASGRQRLESSVQEFTRFGFDCKFVDDEATLLWSKLVLLAPLALSTTAAASPIGEVVADASRRTKLEACVREACAVAIASGAVVDANSVISTIVNLPPPMRSSLQKDVDAGRPAELDAIAGPILRGAEAHELKAPATTELVEAIRKRLAASQG
jgi:2-dehydropantoate 2-reductase